MPGFSNDDIDASSRRPDAATAGRKWNTRAIRAATALLLAGLLAAAAATIAFGVDPDGGDGPRDAGRATAGSAALTPAAGVAVPGTAPGPQCGTAAAAQRAGVDEIVAHRIYGEELDGSETREDLARIRSSAPLTTALLEGDTAAVQAAVYQLVYTPHWHIVRLRVTRGSQVLADVGGPHILAPVHGSLRAHGRRRASFVMSVQDDLGYVKLVTRFIGTPIELYQRGAPVMGTLAAARTPPADRSRIAVAGRAYLSSVLSLHAFPSGPLTAAIFVPATASAAPCEAVRVAAWGNIARHVAARFHPLATHLADLASVLRTVTTGRVFVRAGSRWVVGGGPRRLPSSGSVRWNGRRWAVYSWVPLRATRVYLLTPAG